MEAELKTKVIDHGSKTRKGEAAKVVDLLAVNRSIGRYELIHRLGHGGMASVYLGRATGKAGFERLVAVKVIHPHLVGEPEFVEMFLDEARIAARIHHPHVVAIHDVGEDDGVFYMVMEYVEGDTLAALVRQLRKDERRRLPISAILQIATDACEGLVAAHELADADDKPLGLVHRDVSPHNLLVGMDGRVKVVDFGIMKAAGKRSNTLTGQLRGKLAYMAPEQAEGKELDARTDQFALGAVMWELCTADRLFGGATESAILMNVIDCSIPDVREQRPDIPDGLANVIMKALAKHADDRYASAREMLKDLRVLLRELPSELDPRHDLAAAAQKYFTARVEYARAAVRNRGGVASDRAARPSDHELLAASESTGVATPVLSESELGDTPPLPSNPRRSERARRATPQPDAEIEPAAARDTGTRTNTNTLTASIAGAPARHWSLWLLLPLVGAAIGTAVVAGWPRDEPTIAAAPIDRDATPASTTPRPVEVAPPIEAPEPTPPAQPGKINWAFNTSPPGALVTIAGEPHEARTPTVIQLPESDDVVEVRIEREGYVPRVLRLAPVRTENYTVALEPLDHPTRVRHMPTMKTRFMGKPANDTKADSPPDTKSTDAPPKLEDMPDFRGGAASADIP